MNMSDRWKFGMEQMGYNNASSDKMPQSGGDYKNVDLKKITK